MAFGFSLPAFLDELVKLAVRVPFLHGTNASHKTLVPGVGRPNFVGDPNPRAVYTMMANRKRLDRAADYARKARDAKGGYPTVLGGKMDTKQGWRPRALSPEGEKEIGTVDDALDLIDELDAAAAEPRRGEIWRLLQRGTGAWHNVDPRATVRASKVIRGR